MKDKGTTCLKPTMDGAKQSRWPKETAGAWFSEYSKGFELNYNVTDPQFKFLRLLSSKATQRFVYECSSSVGWFDEVAGNYDKAVQLKAHNDDIVGYSPDEKRFTVQDSCAVSTKLKKPKNKNYGILIPFLSRETRMVGLRSTSTHATLIFYQSRTLEHLTLATR